MNEEKSFSIQCPGCFEWTPFDFAAKDVAFNDLSELRDFLSVVNTQSDSPRILECRTRRTEPWACPAPFQAVIYTGSPLNRRDIVVPNSWMDPYLFRLRKLDRANYVEGYHVVLFCTHKVKRLSYVQLEQLLDLDLLSKAIHGMCDQVKCPITIYAARALKECGTLEFPDKWLSNDLYKGGVCWFPVETYDDDNKNPLLPPGYNPYCAIKRQIFYDHIIKTSTVGWADKQDLNRQPLFLIDRWKCDSCYWSDWEAITQIRNAWNVKKSRDTREYKCHSHFCERAIPIIVHDHLVGVAFCGQTFDKDSVVGNLSPENDLKFVQDFIIQQRAELAQEVNAEKRRYCEWRIELAEKRKEKGLRQLEEAKRTLLGSEKKKFNLDSKHLNKRAEMLRKNVEKIEKLANTRYLHLRMRTESFFKKEILQTVRNQYHKQKIPCIQNVLDRMRDFWIFKGAVVIHFRYDASAAQLIIRKVVKSPAAMVVETPPIRDRGRHDSIQGWLERPHPFHYLYSPEERKEMPPVVKALMKAFEGFKLNMGAESYAIEDGHKKFFVAIPVYTAVWLFIFIERNKNAASPLRAQCDASPMSPVCQESIRETCIEVAHEFVKADMAVDLKKQGARPQKEGVQLQITTTTKPSVPPATVEKIRPEER